MSVIFLFVHNAARHLIGPVELLFGNTASSTSGLAKRPSFSPTRVRMAIRSSLRLGANIDGGGSSSGRSDTFGNPGGTSDWGTSRVVKVNRSTAFQRPGAWASKGPGVHQSQKKRRVSSRPSRDRKS